MHVPGVERGAQQGASAPRRYRDVPGTDEVGHVQRVPRGPGQPDVPGNRRDPGQFDAGVPSGERDRESVVDAGVAVKDDGCVHGVNNGTKRTRFGLLLQLNTLI